MKYTIEVYCRDCSFGQDPLGCFDGGVDRHPERYESVEAAKAAGWAAIDDCGTWEFRVVAIYDETETIPAVPEPVFDSVRL